VHGTGQTAVLTGVDGVADQAGMGEKSDPRHLQLDPLEWTVGAAAAITSPAIAMDRNSQLEVRALQDGSGLVLLLNLWAPVRVRWHLTPGLSYLVLMRVRLE